MSSAAGVNRRDFLATWLGRTRPEPEGRVPSPADRETPTARPSPAALPAPPPVARVAIVQGRHCLAYQRSFCSTCIERCPVPGAIFRRDGFPMVNPAICDGCGICRDVCPAPINAILLLPRRPGT